jgi:hypothetical protein
MVLNGCILHENDISQNNNVSITAQVNILYSSAVAIAPRAQPYIDCPRSAFSSSALLQPTNVLTTSAQASVLSPLAA